MINTVRIYIIVAAGTLIVASLIHLGVLMKGYTHQQAGIAEAVIAAVMLVGLALTWLSGRPGLQAGAASLAFGLLGALVGLFTIIIGIGPRTVPDIIYHLVLIAVLTVGLTIAWKGPLTQGRAWQSGQGGSPRAT